MKYDVAIVGTGIIGLSTAYWFSEEQPRSRIVVIDKEASVAKHQTGRNSGVIHSGIYYRPGSLKAENCRLGRLRLIEFCEREGVRFEICGKIIVAVERKELPDLHRILARGKENGVACELITGDELRDREPHSNGIEAIWVPAAGIIDFGNVARKIASILGGRNCEFRMSSRVVAFRSGTRSVIIETTSGAIEADVVVNCAGLFADRLARLSGVDPGVRIVPFRGEYFELKPAARHLCRNLIYPVPDPGYPFLGIHFTRTMDGRVECGPSAVLALAREGYRFRDVNVADAIESLRYPGFRRLAAAHWRKGCTEVLQSLSKRFYLRAAKRLIPQIRASDLVAAPSGVRAQALREDGSLVDDFLILESGRFVNVCNAPSPAATASLNIGRLVASSAAARAKAL